MAGWKEGASLVSDSGKSIEDLILIVAADRFRLADSFRGQGNKLLKVNAPVYRGAISRFYYAMYHAARACVFLHTKGDDHEAHSKLPTKLPPFLLSPVNWQTKLKDARLLRNRADYESYPKSDRAWKKDALLIGMEARDLLVDSKKFLISKGCVL